MNSSFMWSTLLRGLLSEDWLAVLIAFLLVLLAVTGILGPNGVNLTF